jgi:hypothetical protein
VNWVPYLLNHLNSFINKFHSNVVNLGPRVFMSCPLGHSGSELETWFLSLWNHFIIPYLMGTIMAGIEVCGHTHMGSQPRLLYLRVPGTEDFDRKRHMRMISHSHLPPKRVHACVNSHCFFVEQPEILRTGQSRYEWTTPQCMSTSFAGVGCRAGRGYVVTAHQAEGM